MLGMGACYCRCNATLWKIDPSDGSIVWKRDRGAQSANLVLNSGYVYETGTYSASHDVLSKWTTDGDHVWDTVVGAGAAQSVMHSSVPWLSANSTLYRINDADGSELASVTVFNMGDLWPGPSGDDAYFNIVINPNMRIYDAALAVSSSVHFTTSSFLPIGDDAAANGFVATLNDGGIFKTRVIDTALATVIQANGVGTLLHASTTKVARQFSATSLRLTSLAALTDDWNIDPGDASLAALSLGILDSSHNVYVAFDSGKVARYAAADGAEEWSATTFASSTWHKMLIDSERVYLIGSWQESSVLHQVAALDIADGSVLWIKRLGRPSSGAEMARDAVLLDGSLYVCGDQM